MPGPMLTPSPQVPDHQPERGNPDALRPAHSRWQCLVATPGSGLENLCMRTIRDAQARNDTASAPLPLALPTPRSSTRCPPPNRSASVLRLIVGTMMVALGLAAVIDGLGPSAIGMRTATLARPRLSASAAASPGWCTLCRPCPGTAARALTGQGFGRSAGRCGTTPRRRHQSLALTPRSPEWRHAVGADPGQLEHGPTSLPGRRRHPTLRPANRGHAGAPLQPLSLSRGGREARTNEEPHGNPRKGVLDVDAHQSLPSPQRRSPALPCRRCRVERHQWWPRPPVGPAVRSPPQ